MQIKRLYGSDDPLTAHDKKLIKHAIKNEVFGFDKAVSSDRKHCWVVPHNQVNMKGDTVNLAGQNLYACVIVDTERHIKRHYVIKQY